MLCFQVIVDAAHYYCTRALLDGCCCCWSLVLHGILLLISNYKGVTMLRRRSTRSGVIIGATSSKRLDQSGSLNSGRNYAAFRSAITSSTLIRNFQNLVVDYVFNSHQIIWLPERLRKTSMGLVMSKTTLQGKGQRHWAQLAYWLAIRCPRGEPHGRRVLFDALLHKNPAWSLDCRPTITFRCPPL